ncbi:unnamed protein product [Auanema sp. JU1783]|nr:unnamed protein product [Auanema sp. JU1783]
MGDIKGETDSPASLHEYESNSPAPSLKGENEEFDEWRSGASSPLLGTEPLPLDDQTQCSYCHKDFRKPRVLDCLHSMCEDCIIAQLDGKKNVPNENEKTPRNSTDCELETPKIVERPTPPGVIRCPICMQESHVGNDVRHVYSMLLDYIRVNGNEETRGEKRCRTCKSEQLAVAFCKQCQADLCSNCLQAHGVMRMFDRHETLSYDELEKSFEEIETGAVCCPVHLVPFRFLCTTCEGLACKTCLGNDHVRHKVIDINEKVVNAIQYEIRNLAGRVDNKFRESMNEWSAIPDRASTLNNQFEIAKARVEQTFDEHMRALEEACAAKLNELEDARQKQEHCIEDLYRKMNLTESRVNDALSFTHRLLEKATGLELLASRKKVVQQLNNLSHTMPALGIQSELEFQPPPKKKVDAYIALLSGVVVGRMVTASVKEQVPQAAPVVPMASSIAPASVADHPRASQDSTDWGRPQSNGQAPMYLGAIGTERKKTMRSSSDAFIGWPPCSNPPDLHAPSPTMNVAPLIQKELLTPIPLPTSNRSNNMGAPSPSLNTQFHYNNYQWPSSSTKSAAVDFNNAQLRQKVAALIMQLPNQNGPSNVPSSVNNLLLQNRVVLASSHVDQVLLNGLGNLSMGNIASEGPGVGLRTSPQESARVSELKIHSVFGTSAPGSSIRELHCPSGFCLSETDDILIADTNNHRVTVCGPPCPWKIGRPGTGDGMLCFPKKVVALKGEKARYVVLDKGSDGKTRAQIFDGKGEFSKGVSLPVLVSREGIDVNAATCAANGHLILVDTGGCVFEIDIDNVCVVHWFDASAHLGEASDVAWYENNIYITDFKHHCVQIYDSKGKFLKKLGEPSQTPYPIGIDISKKGEILVADTHGNHLHIVIFNTDGTIIQAFTHQEFRLSRCVGLRVAGSGHVVTLCKHNHTLFVFKPLYINR